MRQARFIIFLALFFAHPGRGEAAQPLFVSGTEGYDTFRIPALAVSTKGTILAFAEGRKNGRSDAGDIDLVLKRSSDNGRTWGELQVVRDDAENTCGNPAPVVDRATGRLFLLSTWNLGTDQEAQIIEQKSRDSRRIFLMRSYDDGATWSEPQEITPDVKKPNWTWYATGPGSGIQIERGANKGRLVIPCDHIQAGTKHYYSHIIYSDDHGESWQLGGTTSQHQVNECQVVELSDGALLLNMRNYDPANRRRQIAVSPDGGITWTDQRFDTTLVEPICQASIRRYSWPGSDKKSVILFSNPAHPEERRNMTVRASFDEGISWPVSLRLHAGPSAYSDIAIGDDGKAFCLYERGEKHPYEMIALATFDLCDLRGAEKMDFWSSQKKGANGALMKFRPEWFAAATALGLEFIRFAPDKLPAADRDFLIGNADHFTCLNETDFALLEQVLDAAHQNELKIVLVMYTLPGCRWRQHNDNVDDFRIWQDDAYQEQAFEFWRQLASRLKNHPAIIGYNPLNEPHPGLAFGFEEPTEAFLDWYEKAKETPADLNRFNRRMVAAIRSVDSATPIILDGYFYADAKGMPFMTPVPDVKTLYAFHNIAPWQFAAFRINKGRYSYPDNMSEVWDGPGVTWDFDALAQRIDPVLEFAAKYNIPSHRIVASEFWCDRRVKGCGDYLADVIALYNSHKWHWSFYEFRPDGDWGGLDYELGDGPMGEEFWHAVEAGQDPELAKNRRDNPLWHVIKREFKP